MTGYFNRVANLIKLRLWACLGYRSLNDARGSISFAFFAIQPRIFRHNGHLFQGNDLGKGCKH